MIRDTADSIKNESKVEITTTCGRVYTGYLNTKTTKRVSKFFIEDVKEVDFIVLTGVEISSTSGDNLSKDVVILNKIHIIDIIPICDLDCIDTNK